LRAYRLRAERYFFINFHARLYYVSYNFIIYYINPKINAYLENAGSLIQTAFSGQKNSCFVPEKSYRYIKKKLMRGRKTVD